MLVFGCNQTTLSNKNSRGKREKEKVCSECTRTGPGSRNLITQCNKKKKKEEKNRLEAL